MSIFCFPCNEFSTYVPYIQLVCASNGLLGAWWTQFRRQGMVDRKAEQQDEEILLEKGSEAHKEVVEIYRKREGIDRWTKRLVGVSAFVIVVLAMTALLIVNPKANVGYGTLVVLVLAPLALPIVIIIAALINYYLRSKIRGIIVKDRAERQRDEQAVLDVRK